MSDLTKRLREEAAAQEAEWRHAALWVDTHYKPELLVEAADRIEALEARLAEAIECCTIKDNRNLRLESSLARAEGVLRMIANTDYRGNRSTEAMAAQCYFDALKLSPPETTPRRL